MPSVSFDIEVFFVNTGKFTKFGTDSASGIRISFNTVSEQIFLFEQILKKTDICKIFFREDQNEAEGKIYNLYLFAAGQPDAVQPGEVFTTIFDGCFHKRQL
jgi:hypothetical protein